MTDTTATPPNREPLTDEQSREPYFMVTASEQQEEPETVRATHLLRKIHDLQCMCEVWDRCETEGINETLIQASSALLAGNEWSIDFEDGWIRVVRNPAKLPPLESEMLEALKAAWHAVYMAWMQSGDNDESAAFVRDAVRSAIAKAESRSRA